MTDPMFKYKELPQELRDQIWEATFEPRQISLSCKTISSHKIHSLPFVYAFPPYPTMPDFPTAQYGFFTTEIDTPIALRVCQESREFALKKYAAWPIFKVISSMYSFNPHIKYKTIMWNPKIDIVDFLGTSDDTLPMDRVLPLFLRQFPIQAKMVQRLAVPSALWKAPSHIDVNMVWSLIDCISLNEFIVVVDKIYELKEVLSFKSAYQVQYPRPWELPRDVEDHIDRLRGHYEKWGHEYMPLGKKPVVRVVEDAAGLFTNETWNGAFVAMVKGV